MLSFLLPINIQVYCTANYIIIKHNDKSFIKKFNKEVVFKVIQTTEGNRLFASAVSKVKASSALSYRYNLIFGLSRGYQQRLRLVGIGFRANINSLENSNENNMAIKQIKQNTKKFIRNRFADETTKEIKFISIKLGYSHEVTYPINDNHTFNVAPLDSRSKGRLIDIQSNNYILLNKVCSEIRSFRYPDAYKGKGIYYNNETIKLKKGKRQG